MIGTQVVVSRFTGYTPQPEESSWNKHISSFIALDALTCLPEGLMVPKQIFEKIKERYGKNWSYMEIQYLIEDEPRGTLCAINNLLRNAEADFYLVMNGDIVTDINIMKMLERADDNSVSIAITRLKSPYGIIKLSGKR